MTLVVGLLLRGSLVEVAWQSLLIQGLGLLSVALFCHHIYVKGQFVERGDPALSWCVIAWGLLFWEASGPWMDQLLSWLSLLTACASLSLTLQMHRQPTTSAIQFRAGALAAVAICLNPQHWGMALGLILIQINTRPSILREWLMLALGGAWGGAVTLFLENLLNSTPGSMTMAYPSIFSDSLQLGGGMVWGALGLLMLYREQSNKNLRMQNSRINTVVFTGSLVAGSCIQIGFPIPWEGALHPIQASPALALPLAFLTVNLIPQWEYHKRNSNRWTNALFWFFVGTLLVLFAQQIIR